ncbi:histidine phosphatase superfamily protein [Nitzschia inconspicua]|uniref:Histidine phosphatase superfamily branch 1 protein n=1 Tax=Nitzschia inconspicua TaxID=303405 RepID=A0A9K3KAR0_9STRA|nr:histidine phosphatase superfamily branch 1 protein [Nitzschia inconspicua]KAG7372820.1 histidine phosphatase superfamily protein [Nitzschia inconspicua]
MSRPLCKYLGRQRHHRFRFPERLVGCCVQKVPIGLPIDSFIVPSIRSFSTIDADAYSTTIQQHRHRNKARTKKVDDTTKSFHKKKRYSSCEQEDESLFSSSSTTATKQSVLQHKFVLPKRIILMRHGESLGNLDENAYSSIPDWKIPLTRRGERQALRAANDLATLLDGESLFAYCSPYKRAKETWDIIQQYLQESVPTIQLVGMREEPRIAEQQFGNFQNPRKVRTAKAERRTFGRFFFRFPNGEAGLDVYNRVSSFLATLSRDIRQLDERYSVLPTTNANKDITMSQQQHQETPFPMPSSSSTLHSLSDVEYNIQDLRYDSAFQQDPSSSSSYHDAMEKMNILIVCHGLTLRLFLMRYFHLTVEEFENSYNSQNAKLVIMDRQVSEGREFYRLSEEAKQALNLKGDVSNERPVYWRENIMADPLPELLLLEDDVDVKE